MPSLQAMNSARLSSGRAFGFRSAGVPPALLKFGSLGRPPLISRAVNSGRLASAFPAKRDPRLDHFRTRDNISNRNWPKYRTYRKQTIKPCLTGARIVHISTPPATRSITR
jgi:hypothetical protein